MTVNVVTVSGVTRMGVTRSGYSWCHPSPPPLPSPCRTLPSPKTGGRGITPGKFLKSIDARRRVLMHFGHKSTHFGGPGFMPVTS